MGGFFSEPEPAECEEVYRDEHVQYHGNNAALSQFVFSMAKIIPTSDEALRSAVIGSVDDIIDHMNTTHGPDFQCMVQPAGSLGEGTHVLGSDFDFVIDLTHLQLDIGPSMVEESFDRANLVSAYKSATRPEELDRRDSFSDLLPAGQVRHEFYARFYDSARTVPLRPGLRYGSDVYNSVDRSGPSIQVTLYWEDPACQQHRTPGPKCKISIDLVIRCSVSRLPAEVMRNLGFMESRLTMSMLQKFGPITNWQFHLVGIDVMWRLSWSHVEKALMNEIRMSSPNAFLCYRVLKYACKTLFQGSCDYQPLVTVAESYLIKNVLFATWAGVRPESWSDSNVGATFVLIVMKLQDALRNGAHSYLAKNVVILESSRWHKEDASKALDRFMVTLKRSSCWDEASVLALMKQQIPLEYPAMDLSVGPVREMSFNTVSRVRD